MKLALFICWSFFLFECCAAQRIFTGQRPANVRQLMLPRQPDSILYFPADSDQASAAESTIGGLFYKDTLFGAAGMLTVCFDRYGAWRASYFIFDSSLDSRVWFSTIKTILVQRFGNSIAPAGYDNDSTYHYYYPGHVLDLTPVGAYKIRLCRISTTLRLDIWEPRMIKCNSPQVEGID